MVSMVRIYNDGPDDLEVTFGSRRPIVVPPNSTIAVTTRQTLDFASPDPLTDKQMAEHMGVSPERYAETNRPPPRVVEP